ncbi:MAG TPA: DUF4019 domain-containing protein [Pyrinomonadaceae bacterium]|nr:DUF4019 domain-containing protein [Pyrinomonadaceae bacterium]
MRDERGRKIETSPLLSLNIRCALVLAIAFFSLGCGLSSERRSIPTEVESTISSVSDDIAAERYEKVYSEASDLWRQGATLEDSVATFKTLRTKLGVVENRVLQSAKEQENSSGPLQGRSFSVTYRTKFELGEGMETFTLIQRNGRWQLARYFVNSTALQ